MKRSYLLILVVLLLCGLTAGALAGCGAAADDTTTTAAAASTGTTTATDWQNVVYSAMAGNGGEAFDLEKWKATLAAAKLLAFMKNRYVYKDEMDPAVLAYWDALGVKKELHDAEDGNKELKWASYTPTEALADDNTAVFPVVFCFHGGNGSIYGAESYGVADQGAKARYITVCASTPTSDMKKEVTGLTTGQQITRILDELDAGGYPVDRGRIYVTGMSIGGMACAWAALEIPDVVTAIAMHSSAAALNVDSAGLGSVGLSVAVGDFTKAMDYGVPMFLAVGDVDMGQLPFKTQGIIDGLNLWLQMNGCPTRVTLADSLAAQASTKNPAVKMIGLEGGKTWTRTIDGVIHNGVEYFDANGVKMVEIVGIENQPHFPSAAYPELAWEFLSRFSRGADGKIVVAK